MRVIFDDTDLRPMLLKAANQRLNLSIAPDDINAFEYETDDDDDVTGVAIEFEVSGTDPNPNPLHP